MREVCLLFSDSQDQFSKMGKTQIKTRSLLVKSRLEVPDALDFIASGHERDIGGSSKLDLRTPGMPNPPIINGTVNLCCTVNMSGFIHTHLFEFGTTFCSPIFKIPVYSTSIESQSLSNSKQCNWKKHK